MYDYQYPNSNYLKMPECIYFFNVDGQNVSRNGVIYLTDHSSNPVSTYSTSFSGYSVDPYSVPIGPSGNTLFLVSITFNS